MEKEEPPLKIFFYLLFYLSDDIQFQDLEALN